MMFDKVAAGAVGIPLFAMFRQRYPGCATMNEMANLARHDNSVPAQITHLVGQKYKLMVSISKKWKLKNGEDLSFQVNRIEETCKPELPSFVGVAVVESGKDTSVSGVSGEKLLVLPPILSPGFNTPSVVGTTSVSPASKV